MEMAVYLLGDCFPSRDGPSSSAWIRISPCRSACRFVGCERDFRFIACVAAQGGSEKRGEDERRERIKWLLFASWI